VRLAGFLALAAGLVDVSGYLDFRQFTSHMTGVSATLAANFGTDGHAVVGRSVFILSAFLFGAVVCALLVNFSRRRERESQFALPLFLESIVLATVALTVPHGSTSIVPIGLLAFTMGLQNAIITKISDAEIRTTHVTGAFTDIGIEIGRAIYWNRNMAQAPVRANERRLGTQALLVFAFFIGGTLAALVYPHYGLHVLLPLACLLAIPTILPIYSDVRKIVRV
jgi:uncharacterized membrane protein YoaK (UPF0700 family)